MAPVLLTGGPATARAELLVVAGITLVLALLAAGARIAPPTRVPGPEPGLFGKWTVAPANVVVETCEVCADGTASGSEPQRWAERKAEASGTSLVGMNQKSSSASWYMVSAFFGRWPVLVAVSVVTIRGGATSR